MTRPKADQARKRRIPSRAIVAIGAIGAVTKTPPKFALQNPANPGLPDFVSAVLKDTSEKHRRQITKTLNRRFTRFS